MLQLNLLLALAWVLITGVLSVPNFAVGFAISYLVMWFVSTDKRNRYFTMMGRRLAFVVYFLWELLRSNLKVAFDVVTPRHYMRPAVLAIPVASKSEREITFLANVITLTPGTLSLSISRDKQWLYVHTMYVGTGVEEARRELIEGLGRRVEGLFP